MRFRRFIAESDMNSGQSSATLAPTICAPAETNVSFSIPAAEEI